MTRVVIADDQTLITQSFKILLETVAPEDIAVVGLAHEGAEAVALVERERPDVVLMDVRMPGMDGVQAAAVIHRQFPDTRIIMLTTFDDDAYVHEAIAAGAVGYLLKDISTEELVAAIQSVGHGAIMVSSSVAQKVFKAGPASVPAPAESSALSILESLSHREIEILKLIAQGRENKEIAEQLHAAEQTIKNGVSIIYTKLGVENRREARKYALRSGLVRPDDILRDI
jgi:DNA-binding NarL/FixJ family response regulator